MKMSPGQRLSFGPYKLDARDERLWRGGQPVELTHKSFAVLSALVARPGQLLTKEELFRTVWPRTVVTDAALTRCVRELRQALRDDAQAPTFIETVHGRGYRFVAPVARADAPPSQDWRHSAPVVGRDAELQQMRTWLENARGGERQVVCVAGEPGLGKTTAVRTFIARALEEQPICVTVGRCIEQFGAGEAYLPVLEALERLDRQLAGEVLRDLLRRYAPSWLAQLPALSEPEEREQLQRQVAGVTRERMLREIVQAFEALSQERTLILWLEDLHWSDYSTLDLMSALARRTEPARLLMIGTYRPVDVLLRKHPLLDIKAELALHGNCHELALQPLSEAAVQDYLEARLGASAPAVAPRTARLIHRRTEGNPLFMTAVVDDSLRRGVLHRTDAGWELTGDLDNAAEPIPQSLRQLIERQLDRLDDPDRRLLEVASVAGDPFAIAAIADAMKAPVEPVEERCVALARHGDFLQRERTSELTGARYRFVHAFHRQAAYERISEARRRQLHARIGEWEERARGDQAGSIAAELAMHFERAQDFPRALVYLQRAAENALRRSAHQDAAALARRGLDLLSRIAEGSERTESELALQLSLGAALVALKGYAAPEVGETYARARELHQQIGDAPRLLLALAGLQTYYVQRADLHTAKAVALQCSAHARDPVSLLLTHTALGTSLYAMGDFLGARRQLEQALALYDERHRDAFLLYGRDPGVVARSFLAGALWHLGYFEQAWSSIESALQASRALSHPFTTAVALLFAASLEVFRQQGGHGMRLAEEAISIASEQRYPYWAATATILRGHFRVESGDIEAGIADMRQALAARQAAGARVFQPFYFTLLASAYIRLGDLESALGVVSQALVQVAETGERGYEAEAYRLQGVILAQHSDASAVAEAETSLRRAVAVAREQQARGWEVRAATDLAHLLQRQGRGAEAQRSLAEIVAWFTEAPDLPDVCAARTLQNALLAEGR